MEMKKNNSEEMLELAVMHTQDPITLQQMGEDLNRLTKFVKEILKRDQDFGVIPYTGKKPTLLKPGAEKLLKFFRYVPRFNLIEKVMDWNPNNPFFYFNYNCTIYDRVTGEIVAEANGSCNSREKKYAYKQQHDSQKPPEPQPPVYTFTIVNTLEKMAQKRALVGATLIATCASMFFTQDIEDMEGVLDAEYEVVENGVALNGEKGKAAHDNTKKGKPNKLTVNQRNTIIKMLGSFIKHQEGETDSELEARKLLWFQEKRKDKKALDDLSFEEASSAIAALSTIIKEANAKKNQKPNELVTEEPEAEKTEEGSQETPEPAAANMSPF